jgi:3-methyladenine DNA glycosylase AlkD
VESQILDELSLLPNQNTQAVRTVRRQFSSLLRSASPEAVVQVALRLLQRKGSLCRFVACELVHFHGAAFRSLNSRLVRKLSVGMENWADVDIFACFISGPAWREGLIPDSLINDWTRSRNRWLRRAALVSTVPLNSRARGGLGDTKRTLKICKSLADDRDDMVVKAMSWALRELAKRDPRSVRAFLSSHRLIIAPRVAREVNNKLVTGLKNPRPKLKAH